MEEMTAQEVEDFVRSNTLGHMALAGNGDAYVIPLFYARDGRTFYFHSHPGAKDEFLETTRQACFAITKAETPDLWASVQVFGRVEKVIPLEEQKRAMALLGATPLPPEAGFTPSGRPSRGGSRFVYVWRLVPTRMVGLKSIPRAAKDDMSTA